jgi:hypothetical protein
MAKHQKALALLWEEMYRLGGKVFARYLATKSPEALKSVEASEFINQMLTGKIPKTEGDYLEQYLEPMYDLNRSIRVLLEDQMKDDPKRSS